MLSLEIKSKYIMSLYIRMMRSDFGEWYAQDWQNKHNWTNADKNKYSDFLIWLIYWCKSWKK